MEDAKLIEALIDLEVEIQAIHIALEQQGIPPETIQELKSEVDLKEVRKKVLERLSGPQSDPGASR